jgi:hypothetical protein
MEKWLSWYGRSEMNATEVGFQREVLFNEFKALLVVGLQREIFTAFPRWRVGTRETW